MRVEGAAEGDLADRFCVVSGRDASSPPGIGQSYRRRAIVGWAVKDLRGAANENRESPLGVEVSDLEG